MSRFSNALAIALRELGWTQTELANRANLKLSYINRYVRGKLGIGIGNLETIVRQLPEKQRAEVVAAWLRDAIPHSSSGLITILTGGTVKDELMATMPVGDLHRDLDRAVRFLIEEARKHTEINDLLIDLERALRGTSKK